MKGISFRDIPYDIRKYWNEFWLVDPLDGTKEFIKRNGEFTVNIALIMLRDGAHSSISLYTSVNSALLIWNFRGSFIAGLYSSVYNAHLELRRELSCQSLFFSAITVHLAFHQKYMRFSLIIKCWRTFNLIVSKIKIELIYFK